jgi:exocyst complex protein 7
MASPDGEQRVLMTAERIVRSLGTTDTMTDDMLQILSKFDHRFSIMHDKKKKSESTSSQDSDEAAAEYQQQQQPRRSSSSSSNSRRPSNVSRNTTVGSAMANESSLDHAEDVIRRWDIRYSEQARQQMIFECPEEEASTYLEAVDEVQKVLDSLSVVQQQQNSRDPETTTTTLERAQNLIELAMGRLQEEFRHLLVKNSRSVEPESLFDSLAAGSFQSSLEEGENDAADDAQEDAEARESSGEEDNADEDVLPVARPAPLVQTTMDLVPPDVAIDLASIAQRMIAAKYQSECCKVYVNSRKPALEESLFGLGVEKLSIDEVQRMPWAAQEDKIRKWIQAMKVGVKVLFASEKLLCDQVPLSVSLSNHVSFLSCTPCHIKTEVCIQGTQWNTHKT